MMREQGIDEVLDFAVHAGNGRDLRRRNSFARFWSTSSVRAPLLVGDEFPLRPSRSRRCWRRWSELGERYSFETDVIVPVRRGASA